MMHVFWNRIARALPPAWYAWAQRHVEKAGWKTDPADWIGRTIVLVFVGAMVGALIGYAGVDYVNEWISTILPGTAFTPRFMAIVSFIIGFFIVLVLRGLHVYYAVENRRKKVEDILPDFLLLVAGNIRAGMTSFSAFKSSARPEFGALSEEIKSVTTRSLGTGSFTQALLEISTSIQSQSLSESVRFFIQANKSGGKIAQLLENTSNDLRRTQDLKRELESSTRTYVIFVAFVMVIATPLLMAVSVSFVELITSIQSQSLVSGDSASGLGFLGGTLSITPAFLEGMAYVLLAGNAILAGLFMGMIGQGKPLLGLRFTIPMLAVSIIVFWISRSFLASLLGVV